MKEKGAWVASVARGLGGWLVTSDVIELVTSRWICDHRKDTIFTTILINFQTAFANFHTGPF